jgi:hypothetical protein
MKRTRLVLAVMTLFAGNMNAATEERQIVDTVSTIFAAALTDDVAKFDSVIASDFYIFDGGARFNGDSVMAFIKAQHAAGKRYEWNVTEPDVHISGDTAWIAYLNKGSITDASGTAKQNWLEIGLPRKTGRQLEDCLHAQHPSSHDASREPWQMKPELSSSARLGSPPLTNPIRSDEKFIADSLSECGRST